MIIILAYQSAMKFWLQVTTAVDMATTASTIKSIQAATGNSKDISSLALQDKGFGRQPYHVLVEPGQRRQATKRVVCHQASSGFPAGSFRRVDKDILVASPELCFLQMATILPLAKLVEWGCFLCGSYAILPDEGLVHGRELLTSKQKLGHYLRKCQGQRGYSEAVKALARICEGSASPQETKLALLLSLPKKQGGYGFPQPAMNHKVVYTAQEQRIYEKHHVVLDLYWPQWKLGIEYDGREYHGDSDAITHDREKSSEMATRQIEVIRVDRNQTRTPKDIYVLAKKIGRITKRYVLRPTESQWEKRKQLFFQLHERAYRPK